MNYEGKDIMEDEMRLKELWEILIKYKKMIISLTSLIVIGVLVYIILQPPTYEAKAVLEIGSNNINGSQNNATNSNSNTNTNTNSINYIELPTNLLKRIELTYVQNAILDHAFISKGSANLIELSALGLSNEEAIKTLNNVIQEIQKNHAYKQESFTFFIKEKIKNLEQQREELVKEKQQLVDLIEQKHIKIDQIVNQNAAVAAIYSIELNNKYLMLNEIKNKIYSINNQLNDLLITISASNITQTSILGDIVVKNNPVKPRKYLILSLSFLFGIIFSIVVAFTLEFKKNVANE